MTHRDLSITGHITNETHGEYAVTMRAIVEATCLPTPFWDGERWSDDAPVTDAEKHAWCIRRTGLTPVYLSQSLYDAAEAEGWDMRHYVVNKPMPTRDYQPGDIVGGYGIYAVEHKMPTSEQMRAETKRRIDAGELLGASHVHTEAEKKAMSEGMLHYGTLRPADEYAKTIWPGGSGSGSKSDPLFFSWRKHRKHISEKLCSGKESVCLPALNGQCTACDNND